MSEGIRVCVGLQLEVDLADFETPVDPVRLVGRDPLDQGDGHHQTNHQQHNSTCTGREQSGKNTSGKLTITCPKRTK